MSNLSFHQPPSPPSPFVPALLVIDCQNDFVTGSLAVPKAASIFPTVNSLLSRVGFSTRIATKDWHPPNHISFASQHPPPGNIPFESTTVIVNPYNDTESYESRLWPVHCVQDTFGAELVSELDVEKLDEVVEKGTDNRVEMYSAFKCPFRHPCVSNSGLADRLKDKGITTVYVVGLAFDYCVKSSAVDAKKEGFDVYVVREGTRSVDPSKDEDTTKEIEAEGVKVIGVDSAEMGWVEKKKRHHGPGCN